MRVGTLATASALMVAGVGRRIGFPCAMAEVYQVASRPRVALKEGGFPAEVGQNARLGSNARGAVQDAASVVGTGGARAERARPSRTVVSSPATADDHVWAWRVVIDGDTIVTIESSDRGPTEMRGGTFAVSGTNLDMSLSCPDAFSVSVPFTATGNELWLFDPSEPNIKVYSR